MSFCQVRTLRGWRMAGHVVCNLAQSILYIFDRNVSNLSVSTPDYAFWRGGSLVSHGRIKRNSGL